ncbi:hypothetical protein [Streptosporangium jomthongense]|uniref:DNA-binding protein n=1 Tax=Streptosporangium jomthongense TaxID=1193683 RepID=A0ABV8FCT7_9ACTN
MTPITWLAPSVAAARLHTSIAEVQRLVDAGRLTGRLLHDHNVISEESVEAFLKAADEEDAMSAHLSRLPFWEPHTRADDPEYWAERDDHVAGEDRPVEGDEDEHQGETT